MKKIDVYKAVRKATSSLSFKSFSIYDIHFACCGHGQWMLCVKGFNKGFNFVETKAYTTSSLDYDDWKESKMSKTRAFKLAKDACEEWYVVKGSLYGESFELTFKNGLYSLDTGQEFDNLKELRRYLVDLYEHSHYLSADLEERDSTLPQRQASIL